MRATKARRSSRLLLIASKWRHSSMALRYCRKKKKAINSMKKRIPNRGTIEMRRSANKADESACGARCWGCGLLRAVTVELVDAAELCRRLESSIVAAL